MANKNGLYAEFSQKRLLVGEDHGHAVGVTGQDLRPLRAPGPELRRDVVEHRYAAPVGLLAEPEVEARVVDRDHQIGWPGRQQPPDLATQTDKRAEA